MCSGVHTTQRGFTLIEVMVALVIITFAFSAFVAAIGRSADTMHALQLRTGAQWVGWNAYVQSAIEEKQLQRNHTMAGYDYEIDVEENTSLLTTVQQHHIHVLHDGERLLSVIRLTYTEE